MATALAGVDPIIMLTGPIPATQRALAKRGSGSTPSTSSRSTRPSPGWIATVIERL